MPFAISSAVLLMLAAPAAGHGAPTVASANARALRTPSPAGYRNAAQVYAWQEGAVYQLLAAPERVSDIALQPGETLVSVAAGDTARWIIGDTTSGSGSGRRTHVLVKPSAGGLRTNLIISTDRRVYLLNLESRTGPAMAVVAWSYPEDALIALARRQEVLSAAPVAADLRLEQLNFDYRIEGDRPPWRPLRAFDDGVRVFIEFPPSIGSGEAPPLFVIGPSRRAELVNYRKRGHYYLVDRLFGAAELRLGEKKQQVVRIVRGRGR